MTEAAAANNQKPKLVEKWQRSRMFGYWKDISPSFAFDGDERGARLAYASQRLGTEVTSWSALTRGQAGRLIGLMREDLNRNPKSPEVAKPDALEIAGRLALELYGGDWYEQLKARLTQRPFFHYERFDRITPRQSHELIEILLDHLERQRFPDDAPGATRAQRKEAIRARFKGITAPRRAKRSPQRH